MKPKAASHIKLEGSGKDSRAGKRKAGSGSRSGPRSGPDNAGNLRAWRIGIIKAAWERVTERQMGAMQ